MTFEGELFVVILMNYLPEFMQVVALQSCHITAMLLYWYAV